MTTERPSDPSDGPPPPHAGFGSATSVWLVRHTGVPGDGQDPAHGAPGVPPSEAGRAESPRPAFALAALRPTLVVCSPLEHVLELAQGVARASEAPLQAEDGLRELHRAQGGESDETLLARAWPPFERAVVRAEGGTLVVVGDYDVIRVLAARALGVAPASSFSLRVDPGRAVVLFDSPGANDPRGTSARPPEGRPGIEFPPGGGWVLRRSNALPPFPND